MSKMTNLNKKAACKSSFLVGLTKTENLCKLSTLYLNLNKEEVMRYPFDVLEPKDTERKCAVCDGSIMQEKLLIHLDHGRIGEDIPTMKQDGKLYCKKCGILYHQLPSEEFEKERKELAEAKAELRKGTQEQIEHMDQMTKEINKKRKQD